MRCASSTRARSSRASPPARRRPRPCWRGRSRSSRATPWSRWSLAATWPRRPPLLSWPDDEDRDPSRVRPRDRSLRLRQRVPDALDQARAARRGVLELPPVLHGQAEADGFRRPRRALPAPAREGRRPQGLESNERPDRRASRPRGRDDARPLELDRRRPQARRADRRGHAPDRVDDEAALALPAARDPRRDGARRVARDRLPRTVDLGSGRSAGGGGGRGGGPDRALARRDLLRLRRRDRVRGAPLQGHARAHHQLAPDRDHGLVRAGRGRDPRHALHRLPLPDLAAARPAARLPVPRGRAQGDQRLRGRGGAEAGDRPALQPDPPPLRHRLPALGDGDRDLRLRLLRATDLVLADRAPHPAAAGDRRDRLRADPLRRQAHRQPRPDDAARARPLAAAADDSQADARPARGLDSRPAGGAGARSARRARNPARRGDGLMEDLVGELERSYNEANARLSDPAVYNDHREAADVGRRVKELEGPAKLAREWREVREDLDAAQTDGDLKEMVPELEERLAALEEELKLALVETDPADRKDVIVEIRQGIGGDEAALWAADIFRMLTRYAERRGFTVEQLEASGNESGGFKEVVFAVKGDGAYSVYKWEAGTHRVQRVPETESQGRIHTSTATVAVMPEAEEVEVEVDPNDLKVDVYRSTGPGGQSVNTTDSAVRITHVPTGIVVAMQDEKSQLQNKTKAMRVLRARLLKAEQDRQAAEMSEARRGQIGGGGRSEKIRTYNYKENRVTDHRVGLTVHNLNKVLLGDLDELIDALVSDERARQLT